MTQPKPFSTWRPHPWHGLEIGPQPPDVVNAYIEITPFDVVKYEVDKETGYLRVDRPQRTSSVPPALYGFIPRTYSGPRVGALTDDRYPGDGDPMDICVFSERPINRSEIILTARVIGGLQMIDHNQVDDKIIAVLVNDNIWGDVNDIGGLPKVLVERLRHYFSTYKMIPGQDTRVSIEKVYDCHHARKVIEASIQDYKELFSRL
jgi:inorganic pyrophosphatase